MERMSWVEVTFVMVLGGVSSAGCLSDPRSAECDPDPSKNPTVHYCDGNVAKIDDPCRPSSFTDSQGRRWLEPRLYPAYRDCSDRFPNARGPCSEGYCGGPDWNGGYSNPARTRPAGGSCEGNTAVVYDPVANTTSKYWCAEASPPMTCKAGACVPVDTATDACTGLTSCEACTSVYPCGWCNHACVQDNFNGRLDGCTQKAWTPAECTE